MNHWTKLSIELARQTDYLDRLFSVYPLAPEKVREVDEAKWTKVADAYKNRDNNQLINSLLDLKLFPIKDSYVSFLRKNREAIKQNPATVQRILDMVYEMDIDELYRHVSQPKETNRQIGQLFRRWVNNGNLGVPLLDKDEFLTAKHNSVLSGGDDLLKNFAKEHLGYRGDKGIDLVAKFNGKYVVGEAKFITSQGGNQNNQIRNAVGLLEAKSLKATAIGIFDGVLYLPGENVMTRTLKNNPEHIILSSLLLKEYLNQV